MTPVTSVPKKKGWSTSLTPFPTKEKGKGGNPQPSSSWPRIGENRGKRNLSVFNRGREREEKNKGSTFTSYYLVQAIGPTRGGKHTCWNGKVEVGKKKRRGREDRSTRYSWGEGGRGGYRPFYQCFADGAKKGRGREEEIIKPLYGTTASLEKNPDLYPSS